MRILVAAVVAYLVGCVPVAQFIERLAKGRPWVNLAATAAGFAKGFLVLAYFHPVSSFQQALLVTALVAGDQWPIQNKDAGRLGLAVAGGAMTALTPIAPVLWGLLWGVGFVLTGYRVVGRLVALVLFWIVLGVIAGWPLGFISMAPSFMILTTSRGELARLRLGQEPKHHWRADA